MKLDESIVGKKVRLRDGAIITIDAFHPQADYPLYSKEDDLRWTQRGLFYLENDDPNDIVSVLETNPELEYRTPTDPTLEKLNGLQSQIVELSNKMLEMQAQLPTAVTPEPLTLKSWELLKHLEEGGLIKLLIGDDTDILKIKDLHNWDYDPIRSPEDYIII